MEITSGIFISSCELYIARAKGKKRNNSACLKKPILDRVSPVQRSNQLIEVHRNSCGAHTRFSCIYTKVMKMGGYRVAFFVNAPSYV